MLNTAPTNHCVPLLVDVKIHFALLKLCYGAAYVPWNVPQLLLVSPLVYGVWHSYKYYVELIYRAFLPFLKLLGQGDTLHVGNILPRKVKVIHTEKTLPGLLLATPSSRARLDELVSALLSNHQDLTPHQRKGRRMLLALKALLYTYCPAILSIGRHLRCHSSCHDAENLETTRALNHRVCENRCCGSLVPESVAFFFPSLHPLRRDR